MKLYELTQNYNNLLELIENGMVSQEDIRESLELVNDDISEKIENICKIIQQNKSSIQIMKDEEKRIANNRKTLENSNKNLMQYIQESLQTIGIKQIKGQLFKVNIQKNKASVVIDDEKLIDEKYKKEETLVTIDKNALYDDLKVGNEVLGAKLVQTESVRIR